GRAGIDRAASLAQHYSQLGFAVESQVRYHPTDAENGDMEAWVQYVREVTSALAADPSLVALTITNEVNFSASPNTSDGAYKDALDALVLGIVAAHEELAQLGRTDVALGFSYAYRYLPTSDADFWKGIAARATPAFYRALDYVGVQLYPGPFGVTDYRYFNLRHNVPNGTDLFDDVGLLRADYTQKPAFSAYRDLIVNYGSPP